jgi:hypothetical protein
MSEMWLYNCYTNNYKRLNKPRIEFEMGNLAQGDLQSLNY